MFISSLYVATNSVSIMIKEFGSWFPQDLSQMFSLFPGNHSQEKIASLVAVNAFSDLFGDATSSVVED